MPGGWLLARMGDRVLRPVGPELTLKMLDALSIGSDDAVLELPPGLQEPPSMRRGSLAVGSRSRGSSSKERQVIPVEESAVPPIRSGRFRLASSINRHRPRIELSSSGRSVLERSHALPVSGESAVPPAHPGLARHSKRP